MESGGKPLFLTCSIPDLFYSSGLLFFLTSILPD